MYYSIFDIVDFDDEDKPYSVVEVSKKEGFNELSPLYARIREFKIYSVGNHYNIDLVDFLNLPHHVAEMIMDDSRRSLSNSSSIKDKAERDALKKLERDGLNMGRY